MVSRYGEPAVTRAPGPILMNRFPEPPKDEYPILYLEDTDRELPERINIRTRYAYFKTIARGGKSIIQSCKDLHLARVICYKSLKPEFKDDVVEQKRFLREARVTACLQHPNIVPTYELGRDPRGNYYFTMKLVHGYTLREIFDYRERYDLSQLIDVIIQVAHALEYAHSHGVAHRDVKPENILAGPFGEVLLLDWGLAKVWDPEGKSAPEDQESATTNTTAVDSTITGQGNLQGTATYMSPEQVRGDSDIDHRTDIYTLGVVLHELLSGQILVKGETVDKALEEILESTPEPPSAVSSFEIPKRLEELCMACLDKEPAGRIQTAGELIREIHQAGW